MTDERPKFKLDVAIRQCKEGYHGYECREFNGLPFHCIGHNSTHVFWVAEFQEGFLVYSYCCDVSGKCDEHVAYKSPEAMVGSYLGHW